MSQDFLNALIRRHGFHKIKETAVDKLRNTKQRIIFKTEVNFHLSIFLIKVCEIYLLYTFKKKTFAVYLSNVTQVLRSSYREEFWGKCVLRNSCPLIQTCETFVKIVEKIPVKSPCLQPYSKMNFFTGIFQGF